MAKRVDSLTQLPLLVWERACGFLRLGDMLKLIDKAPSISLACKPTLVKYRATFRLRGQNHRSYHLRRNRHRAENGVFTLTPFAMAVLQRLGQYIGHVTFITERLEVTSDTFECITSHLTSDSSYLRSLCLVYYGGFEFFRPSHSQNDVCWLQILDHCVATKTHTKIRIHARLQHPSSGPNMLRFIYQLQHSDLRCQLMTHFSVLFLRVTPVSEDTADIEQRVVNGTLPVLIFMFANLSHLMLSQCFVSSDLVRLLPGTFPTLKSLHLSPSLAHGCLYDSGEDISSQVWSDFAASYARLRTILSVIVRAFSEEDCTRIQKVFKSTAPVTDLVLNVVQFDRAHLPRLLGFCQMFKDSLKAVSIALELQAADNDDHCLESLVKSVDTLCEGSAHLKHVDRAVCPSTRSHSVRVVVFRILSAQPRWPWNKFLKAQVARLDAIASNLLQHVARPTRSSDDATSEITNT